MVLVGETAVARLIAAMSSGMSLQPRTRRNERSASSIPTAIHRLRILPSPQFFTRPDVVRTIEIIDSMQFVFVNVRRNRTGRRAGQPDSRLG